MKLLHRFRQHMGGVVPDELQGLGIVSGNDSHLRILGDGIGQIGEGPILHQGDGLLLERLGNGGGEFGAR